MNRYLILMLLLGLSPVLAQDSETETPAETEGAATEAAADEETAADELEDDFELDIQTDHTEDDEDVFEASVEVSYQQSVPFPTDI